MTCRIISSSPAETASTLFPGCLHFEQISTYKVCLTGSARSCVSFSPKIHFSSPVSTICLTLLWTPTKTSPSVSVALCKVAVVNWKTIAGTSGRFKAIFTVALRGQLLISSPLKWLLLTLAAIMSEHIGLKSSSVSGSRCYRADRFRRIYLSLSMSVEYTTNQRWRGLQVKPTGQEVSTATNLSVKGKKNATEGSGHRGTAPKVKDALEIATHAASSQHDMIPFHSSSVLFLIPNQFQAPCFPKCPTSLMNSMYLRWIFLFGAASADRIILHSYFQGWPSSIKLPVTRWSHAISPRLLPPSSFCCHWIVSRFIREMNSIFSCSLVSIDQVQQL